MLSKNVAKLSGCNMGHAVAARLFLPRGVPSIRAKALSRTKISSAFASEVEDQDSGNLTLNHISVEDRFHQPSIRPSTSTMILLCEHPVARGCESAQSRLRSSLRRPGAPAGCSRCERCPDTRWLVERFHRRVIQVRFPESWSSTFSGKASGAHAPPRIFLS